MPCLRELLRRVLGPQQHARCHVHQDHEVTPTHSRPAATHQARSTPGTQLSQQLHSYSQSVNKKNLQEHTTQCGHTPACTHGRQPAVADPCSYKAQQCIQGNSWWLPSQHKSWPQGSTNAAHRKIIDDPEIFASSARHNCSITAASAPSASRCLHNPPVCWRCVLAIGCAGMVCCANQCGCCQVTCVHDSQRSVVS